MFRVKICGITSVADAQLAASSGADAIGLNFFSGSKRYCMPDVARQIAGALPASIRKVGVFVNAAPAEVLTISKQVGLDAIQLHGDEAPEVLQALRPWPIVRAFRVDADLAPLGQYLDRCHQLRCLPRMILLDAASQGQFGGTGQTLDWPAIAAGRPHLRGLPLVLAGGLTADNVSQAIAAVHPWAVDVASGVESRPGQKSAERVQAFVANALESLARMTARW
jgi:phosphoribosylanthranilate isomerase